MFLVLCFFATLMNVADGQRFWDAVGDASGLALQVCGLFTLSLMVIHQIGLVNRDFFNKWVWYAWY